MKAFMDQDFLLETETAKMLYHEYAAKMPVLDYHCHISPQEIAEDRQFENITQVWLGGDHYKWRQMRSNGIEERYITGDASDREKFQKWAETLERAIGNPLYHWSHLELEPEMKALSDADLKDKTREFKERLKEGETLDDILPEAYAVVREGAYRSMGMRHYRVQLIGGIILHQGRIAEMRTGEGKTLVSTLPAYLNALEEKGVHHCPYH